MCIDYEKLKKLISLVEKNELTELTVEKGGLCITVKAEQSQIQSVNPAQQTFETDGDSETDHIEDDDSDITADNQNHFNIISPMVGVFYRCPSPDSPPYVDTGDFIETGQHVGMIEAMKVFSEVPSEVSGRVISVPVENGSLVQQGEILVVIDTSIVE